MDAFFGILGQRLANFVALDAAFDQVDADLLAFRRREQDDVRAVVQHSVDFVMPP